MMEVGEAGTNWIDFYIALLGIIKVSLVPLLVLVGALAFKRQLGTLTSAIIFRIRKGDDVKFFGLSLETTNLLEKIERIEAPDNVVLESHNTAPSELKPSDTSPTPQSGRLTQYNLPPVPRSQSEWEAYREDVYNARRGFYLTYIITPSKVAGQKYDIYILVDRHKPTNPAKKFDDIQDAEFFLGIHWANRVFREKPHENVLGFSTSAYGPFLCVAKLNLTNGDPIMLDVYIDFKSAPPLAE